MPTILITYKWKALIVHFPKPLTLTLTKSLKFVWI